MKPTIEFLYKHFQHALGLNLVSGNKGLEKKILHLRMVQAKFHAPFPKKKAILIFSKEEIVSFNALTPSEQNSLLVGMNPNNTLAVISSHSFLPDELIHACRLRHIPLFFTQKQARWVQSQLNTILKQLLVPQQHYHGCLLDILGLGVMIQGDSGVGKSDLALGLIDQGHRLVADDVVCLRKLGRNYLEGSGIEISRHHMEVRGIGIINVEKMFGPAHVRKSVRLDLIVKLEHACQNLCQDRWPLGEKTLSVLGIKVPFHVFQIGSGRNMPLLLKTMVLNHCLKKRGYHAARSFRKKLHSHMEQKIKNIA